MKTTDASTPDKKRPMGRRDFLTSAAAGAAFTILPSGLVGAAAQTTPSKKINVAIIGTGGQGMQNMRQLFRQEDVHIAALCDVNQSSDYSMFYYGDTAGLQPALGLVKERYGEPCPTYLDYREMLDKEDIDAVLVATPDHSHATISLDVLAKGKHLYCEKPLCRTIAETRQVTEAARLAKVATQMGNQGHSGEGIRLTCEWIWDGAIGDIQEVHAWTHSGPRHWTQLTARPTETQPVPEGLDWKRWLGRMPYRPYHIDYAPVRWRSWWEFGTGAIGDFVCHHIDPAFWALKLDQIPNFSVEASSYGVTDDVCPAASLIHYDIPAHDGMDPIRISWYDGGLKPARPRELEAGRRMGDNGILFIGTKGKILAGGWGGTPRIIPESKMQKYNRPREKTLRRTKGHHRDWLNACKGLNEASGHFNYSGPLTEFGLMGNVALRSEGKKLDFDWKNMNVTNHPEANHFIHPHYREDS
jgi:predicted dehydrogenase